MTSESAYIFHTVPGRSGIRLKCCCIVLGFVLLWLPGIRSFAQEGTGYDQISVFLDIPRIGGGEIDAVIQGQEVFLPVTDLFDFLKIRNVPSPGLDTITGFFIHQDVTYRIDRIKNQIRYGEQLTELEPGDLIRTETNLYLRARYFGQIFGLDCIFDFRNLSVTVNTKLELPMIREMRLEEMRLNMTRLKGEVEADTTIGRNYPLFHFGMADWSVIATERNNGNAEARMNLTLGSMIAGGEATASLNYDTEEPFTEKQQYYLWRYVNNDNSALRQVMAGKITTHATSSIYNPVVGVQFTNTPTTFRRSFGTYTLSDHTEPGWIVELYVNNVLVDYVKADASGFFTFEVPLVYGNSIVKLKFYGPWGEERSSERNISIPFNFIPVKTLEYNVSAGVVEDSLFSRFSRTSVNYGLSKGVTIGAGFEYLSSVSSGPMMPFLNGSFRLASNLLLSGEYAYDVRSKATLTYRLPSNVQVDLSYTKYAKDQKAINYNYREERKASLSIPIRTNKISLYNRLSVNQLLLPTVKYTTSEWLISGSFFGVNTNITTYAIFIGATRPYVYSNLSLSYRLPSGFTIMPQAQYSYTDNQLLSGKLKLEKRLFQFGFLSMSYERNFKSNLNMAELGFRYDFRFAQTGISTRLSNHVTTHTQYARGSILYDRSTKFLGTDKRTHVGRGGITILPFLDINANGTKDPGEPKVYGLNLRSSGGRIERSEKDTIIRILGLEPYTNCFIELDPGGFDNISWQLKNRTMSVAVDPNMLKLIEIPISVVGEASGMVMIEREGETIGLARIIVNYYTKDNKLSGRTLTEEDGYFSYFGFAPGAYTVKIDTSQLRKLGMESSPDSISFNINPNIEGEFVDGLDFTVRMKTIEKAVAEPERITIRKDTTYLIIHEVVQEVMTSDTDSYAIQLGAFKRKSNADAFRKKLVNLLGKEVDMFVEDGFYKVRITGFETRSEIDGYIPILNKNGVKEMWVITLKGMKKHWVVTTRQDTITEVIETVIENQGAPFREDFHIQVGAFRDSARADALSRKMSAAVDRPVVVVTEDGYYKVRITGFTRPEERNELIPVLNILGFNDIWLMPYNKAAVPPVTQPVTEPLKEPEAEPEKKIEIPVVAKPTVSLQVAVFASKAQANRAKKRIIKKLDLPVEIVQEWDYYRVIVTGFYSRQETNKYYPELVGLGYDNIYLIDTEQ